jgi:hypothetical protein
MVNTLRRKMFKMGGNVPKAHGVGITSNLKMKKGGMIPGKVGEPIFTKQGPDGKEREMQNPLALLGIIGSRAAPFLFTGGRSVLGAGRALRGGVEGFKNFFRARPTGPRGAPIRTTGPRGDVTIRSAPREITRMDRVRQAARIGATGLGGAAGLGGISALAPRIQDPQSIGARGLETVRGITEGALDLSTLIPSTVAQLGRKPEDLQGTAGLIRSALYGDTKAPTGDKKDEDVSDRTREIRTQQSEFEGLSEKAEALAKEISRENNLKTLSQAALTFGQAASAGEDLATSLSLGTAPIFDELGRRRDLQENIAGQLATQIIADEATQSAMIAEAAKTGDPAAVNRMQKYFDAYNEGVTNILPVDAKGKMDTKTMAPGTVYMDLEGASGSRYVAVNSAESGGIPKPFDSVEDANAYAQT